jgi:hypothetical protein
MDNVAECCGASCFGDDLDDPMQPCYVKVVVIDEESSETDSWWVHACQGHRNGYGTYIPRPDNPLQG